MNPQSRMAYQSQAVETAGPAQLLIMCYDGALAALLRARLAEGHPETVNRELQRAQDILTELQCGLNFELGGEIARNLDALYTWCQELLLDANITKDLSKLADVESVLVPLRDAWVDANRTAMAEALTA